MRFKSAVVDGYQIFAVGGANTISFAIDFGKANTKDLLGFAVERYDPKSNERYFMRGYKVFPSVVPNPPENISVSTFEHPIQSFVWDDFTAKPGHTYTYSFYPIKGKPKNLDHTAGPVSITASTESQFSTRLEHEVFFNRGVASSQAYAREFENKRPDDLPPERRALALQWLSRDLDEALLKFIANAKAGDTLLCCFYEFRYRPVADALKSAIERKVNVQLIVDAKVNETTDKKGNVTASFPREDNLRMLSDSKISLTPTTNSSVFLREANANDIQHNKFMVLLKGPSAKPSAVWTGSTNLSLGAIHGQTNVGHWVRNAALAKQFRDYWYILQADPGSKEGMSRSDAIAANKAFKTSVEAVVPRVTDWTLLPQGITAVFSPATKIDALETYATMLDAATDLACITFAFQVNDLFKTRLQDNTPQSHLTFLLLEKQDKKNPNSAQPFIQIDAKNNVYQAWGSYLQQPLHQWAKETTAGILGLNHHVNFIHSKFLMMDPLGADPIVVSGSANFSDASTRSNDENMIIIRGNKRVADIYFTEFNRLFNHYYFRSIAEATAAAKESGTSQPVDGSLELVENDSWLKKYTPGKLRHKRVQVFINMHT
jgi:phosphatidylserine/phosphatidylglycerophosphate/cardiolipin synthase-like enzyme